MFLLLAFLLLIFFTPAFSQFDGDIPIGSWRAHPSCKSFSSVEVTRDYLYAGSEAGFIRYKLSDNSVEVLSKSDGLSDIGITTLNYYKSRGALFIGYSNGNMDILFDDNTVINISDIKRKRFPGSKAINHISFNKNLAYLATGFGLVIFDLDKQEIKETAINIGPSGKQLEIVSSTISGDSIFIATNYGVMVARTSSNLLDFTNWYTYTPGISSLPKNNVVGVESLNGSIYALVSIYLSTSQQVFTDSAGLYRLNGSSWQKLASVNTVCKTLRVSQSRLTASCAQLVVTVEGNRVDSIPFGWTNVKDAVYDPSGSIWLADFNFGLISNKTGLFEFYQPNSVSYGVPFKLVYTNQRLFNIFGGYFNNTESFLSTKGMDDFYQNRWTNYSHEKGNLSGLIDFVDIVYDPIRNHYFLGTYGQGVIELDSDFKRIANYTHLNSPLVNQIEGAMYVRIGALKIDREGNLWVANNVSNSLSPVISKIDQEGQWTPYVLKLPSSTVNPREMVIDNNNNKWVQSRPDNAGNLFVFNEVSQKNPRVFNEGAGRGGLPGKVLSLAVDKNGDVWAGTEKGIAVFKNGADLASADFTLPYYDGFPLLMDKAVSAIEVDAGNRKWIGTKDGLWLFNEDASEPLDFFTEENSPLPSSEIKDIEIHQKTGEVFISTMNGLVSYRGVATESKEDEFSDVKVFPNPIKENFDGLVGISGLASGASVKITDIFGNLLYETFAEGGTAVWNGKNYNGEKAKTGVYLIFSATKDGQEGLVSKIAVVE